ncbi:hypothetical protein FRACA_170019 [Frankia canadensis]|uniref:Uncharacterized protein n=1 Tax=Frankia canadensis TaxID=1836972 RepID=A0A2I2KN33_9ACTN|nr:hypothetical protein [Frankia canadensis]SNQ47059.1 hypothetical protein FRACA_170019 [Frankia canadensis]SOU54349.1 hypothetical protein FRACA_170019 [Frankia canadensis]
MDPIRPDHTKLPPLPDGVIARARQNITRLIVNAEERREVLEMLGLDDETGERNPR